MRNISLLPPEIRLQQKAKRKSRFYLLICLLALCVFSLAYAVLWTVTLTYRTELHDLQQQKEVLEQSAAGLQEFAEMQEQVNTIAVLAREAMGNVPGWTKILIAVSRQLPPDVWLADLSFSFQEDRGEATVRGWGSSYASIARWLENLQEIEEFEKIRCQFSSEASIQDQVYVQFEIKAEILPAEPFQLEVVGGL